MSPQAQLEEFDFEALRLRDDNPSSVDMLGFGDIVKAIASTVTRRDLDPITVGVNAPWGGGKTTVLELLRVELDDRTDVIPIYVSPWEYDRNTDTKAALIDAVLRRLESEIKGEETAVEAVRAQLQKLRKRVNLAKAVALAASSALTMTLPGVNKLVDLFERDQGNDDPTLQGFRTQFDDLLSSPTLEHIHQVVVLVDDLDRSLPNTVVETLETIKLFLSVEKMGFVIAADEDNVARSLSRFLESSGQPTTARHYLEKIIHIPFRIPALSRERTEGYLAMLLLAEKEYAEDLRLQLLSGGEGSLSARVRDLVSPEDRPFLELAERLAPILHKNTQGNPRRIKRFLNALWLRAALARSRGVDLETDAFAKLMVVELHYPDLFAQILGWLSAGNLQETIEAIESGEGDFPAHVLEWGALPPPLKDLQLSPYLLLAASLRGDTVEEAALPPDLRDLARDLTSESETTRRNAVRDAQELVSNQRAVLAHHLAAQLRLQRDMQRQQALAEVLSALSAEPSIASSAAQELGLMDPSQVSTPVPLALLATNRPDEFIAIVENWLQSPDTPPRTKAAAEEALSRRS